MPVPRTLSHGFCFNWSGRWPGHLFFILGDLGEAFQMMCSPGWGCTSRLLSCFPGQILPVAWTLWLLLFIPLMVLPADLHLAGGSGKADRSALQPCAGLSSSASICFTDCHLLLESLQAVGLQGLKSPFVCQSRATRTAFWRELACTLFYLVANQLNFQNVPQALPLT